MFEWIRRLPHLQYGKCGGFGRDCSIKPPRDWMDLAFEQHDKALYAAEDPDDRKAADHALARTLRCGDPKKLGLYGRFYRKLAMLIFRL